ncbi:hypothetical protein [Streptomyces sp. NPDC094049]|uniref:hypothetical protein n=1 Tax=Streptomyces sp. NPDC094049 TaxID=3154987 RepID=UPI00331A9CBB
MARLVSAVHVFDPELKERVILLPGDEPSAAVARLITAPKAWEGGMVPEDPVDETGEDGGPGGPEGTPEPKKVPPRRGGRRNQT